MCWGLKESTLDAAKLVVLLDLEHVLVPCCSCPCQVSALLDQPDEKVIGSRNCAQRLHTKRTASYLESSFKGVHVRAAPHNAHLPCLAGHPLPLNGVDVRIVFGVLARPLGRLIAQRQHNLQQFMYTV